MSTKNHKKIEPYLEYNDEHDPNDLEVYKAIGNNCEAENLGIYFEDNDNFETFFTRVDSADIFYEEKPKKAKLIGNYIMGHVLGEGAYGKVKECLHMDTLSRRAVKITKQRSIRKIPNGITNVKREITILKKLNNIHVIKLFDVLVCEEKQKMFMFMEYCVCSLQSMIESTDKKCFPIWQAHLYFKQLIAGVEYLHARGIIHKDIKPQNLLLSKDQILKITDFGVAEELDMFSKSDKCTLSQGSPAFQSPEISNGDEFSGYKADIWSCGVTLYNITTGKLPFLADNLFKLLNCIIACEYEIPTILNDELCIDCIKHIIQPEVTRFSIEDIKKHEWFKRKYLMTDGYVQPPPLFKGDDPLKRMSVIPYLEILYEEDEQNNEELAINKASVNNDKNNSNCDAINTSSASDSNSQKNKRKNQVNTRKFTFDACKIT